MRKQFLIYGFPAIENAEIEEVLAVMQSGWLGTGPRVARFEQDFAEYKGIEHTIALNSYTAALHLSILAARIGPGDEVITTHFLRDHQRHYSCIHVTCYYVQNIEVKMLLASVSILITSQELFQLLAE